MLRMAVFALFALLFYGIGKVWKESYYVTTCFCYPISAIAAIFQLFYFLPKRSFLRKQTEKIWNKVKKRLLEAAGRVTEAFERLGERFRSRFQRKAARPVRRRGKQNGAYRDEFLYAEGNGLFGRKRRHLRWRDMKTNEEKIRFFYMRYVLTAVKQGAPFASYFTPGELKALWKEPEGSEPITGLYYRARYGGREIEAEELAEVMGEKEI